jgi:hypothetical protein
VTVTNSRLVEVIPTGQLAEEAGTDADFTDPARGGKQDDPGSD